MTLSTVFGTGPTSGEFSVKGFPKDQADSRPGVNFAHGAGQDETFILEVAHRSAVLGQRVSLEGFTSISATNGGKETWGNSTSVSRMTDNYNALQTMRGVKPGKIALVGLSMGGQNSLVWAAQNKEKVSCIVLLVPVINIDDIVRNNREGAAANASSAYAGGWSENVYGAVSNPQTLASSGKLSGIPILMFYGTADPICIPSESIAFAGKPGMTVTSVPMNGGHDGAGANHDQIVSFLNQYN